MVVASVGDAPKNFVLHFGTYRNRWNVSAKKNVAAYRETKLFWKERALRRGVSSILVAMPHRKDHRSTTFHSCGEDNGLELGRVSRRRVKIGLRLAGSHYNNYGRVAGKLHATVPLTVSPG